MPESWWIRAALPFPASLALPALGLCAVWLLWPQAAGVGGVAIAALAGLAAWTLLEYVLHRFMMHHVEPFRAWHLAHHRNPLAPIRVPVAFSLALVLVMLGLPLAVLGVLGMDGLAAPFSVGLLLGDVLQESVHQRLHAQEVSGHWLSHLREHHGGHHFRDESLAFGTLTDFWDRCFGTCPPSAERR
ncbi:sterol desaturase family protein [Thauera linaloolentis]|uniref:Fatty acid hydroxylase n=1 Tax=Thauera linaloolentis (strain DSM 12138 / JCM 21573 / CCUG 41526 / CIP 105981 / IAM 15112 / NBRC 102519 / 47Lol) TaxID=1123367 RepID=N6ZCQ6_THAL4|nr:sterol desaturase family protein [Thauera linaloolentis]ENO89949.1 fatty acid hydroxylase [Thauera linaloolentis 47Lol = DSM 12138]MCM8566624.1 sterol desaturase family protein [Thauera linaloolentis]